MKHLFEGPEGRERLLNALLQCEAVRSDRALGEELADAIELRQYFAGSTLIQHGVYDSDMAFLLCGEVAVHVRDRVVAHRKVGDHIGEMAAIDPRAPRSATVMATKPTLAAWVQESQLVTIADKHPRLWRTFAATLADRLRERGRLQRSRRLESRVLLVGGPPSAEMTERLTEALSGSRATLVPLRLEDRPSTLPLDELRREAEEVDFAIVDLRTSGATMEPILELGLLLGVLDRERVFLVCAKETKLPGYLTGLTMLSREAESWSDETVTRIAARVAKLEPR